MKLRTSKKEINNSYNTVLKVGYRQLQTLLNWQELFAYSWGVCGWSCDYYNINGVIISTGYLPTGQQVDYNLVREYEKKAEACNGDKGKINALLNEFIEKATK